MSVDPCSIFLLSVLGNVLWKKLAAKAKKDTTTDRNRAATLRRSNRWPGAGEGAIVQRLVTLVEAALDEQPAWESHPVPGVSFAREAAQRQERQGLGCGHDHEEDT